MTASVVRVAALAAIATCALIAVVQLAPERRSVALSIYLLLLGAGALRLLVRLVGLAHPSFGPSELDAALLDRRERREPPGELEALRRTLALASVNGVYAHNRLRPELHALAAELLAWRQGIDLVAEPAAARSVLGEATWELLRPDREEPPEHDAPGLPPARLARIVTDLEGVPRR